MQQFLRLLTRLFQQRGALAYSERDYADGGRTRRLIVILETRGGR